MQERYDLAALLGCAFLFVLGAATGASLVLVGVESSLREWHRLVVGAAGGTALVYLALLLGAVRAARARRVIAHDSERLEHVLRRLYRPEDRGQGGTPQDPPA